MYMDEQHIKNILAEKFEGVFTQFEFTLPNSYRPDYVVLKRDSFTYFEVKSDKDTLSRFKDQARKSEGFFTHYNLVVTRKNYELAKYLIMNNRELWHWDLMLFQNDDFKKDDIIIRIPKRPSRDCIAGLLWKAELKEYVRKRGAIGAIMSRSGHRVTLSGMCKYDLEKAFALSYGDNEMLRILNEILPSRNWNF